MSVLNPSDARLLDIIFITPPEPSESYLTSGLVTISTWLMFVAGIELSDVRVVGLPSIRISMFLLPLRNMLLSLSIVTDGWLLRTSVILPVELAVLLERSTFVFSIEICFSSVLPVTVAAAIIKLLKLNVIGASI